MAGMILLLVNAGWYKEHNTTMSTSPEHSGTYFVANRSDEDELMRLQIQDQLLTDGMGGVLPEQADPTIFERVLDVGCGTGGWLIAGSICLPRPGCAEPSA